MQKDLEESAAAEADLATVPLLVLTFFFGCGGRWSPVGATNRRPSGEKDRRLAIGAIMTIAIPDKNIFSPEEGRNLCVCEEIYSLR